jgi:hypothetical protein
MHAVILSLSWAAEEGRPPHAFAVRTVAVCGILQGRMALPAHARFRPLEVIMLLLGVFTWGGLTVVWFRMLPAMIEMKNLDLDRLQPAARLVTHLGFQIPVLVGVMVLMAAGAAARVSAGSKYAARLMAAGVGLSFGSLLLTVNVFYDPLLNEEAVPVEESIGPETGPVDWGE